MSRANEEIAHQCAKDVTGRQVFGDVKSIILAALAESNAQVQAENARLLDEIRRITAPAEVGGGVTQHIAEERDQLRAALDMAEVALNGLRPDIHSLSDRCGVNFFDSPVVRIDQALARIADAKGGK